MGSKGKLLWRIFSKHRLDSNDEVDKVRASASELLGLYSLLRHFFATQVDHTPALQPNLDSFQACCDVLDCILAAKKHLVSPREVADTLRAKIARFMKVHPGSQSHGRDPEGQASGQDGEDFHMSYIANQ